MTGTGPQKYPGASTAYWYEDNYPGNKMEVNVLVLHTTEGTSLPDYSGGSIAPNMTAVPDFANKKLKWYQHFNIDTSSRALANKPGGVETNTLNVTQLELVGTCDPATHKKWTTAGRQHIFWPEAPEWALAELAKYVAWLNLNHQVPITSPLTWLAYPASGQAGSSARLSAARWNDFKGICGHMHVPENDHGDPGNINIARIMYSAMVITGAIKPTPTTPTTPPEGNVTISVADAKLIAKQTVTGAAGMKDPNDDTKDWALSSFVELTYNAVLRIEEKVDRLLAAQQPQE